MASDTERIKELLNIADVIGEYIELRQAGSVYKALCPFHNEKTPSFIVSPSRGNYHCFGCGASGDVFSFVQEFEGLDFKTTLQKLARQAGVELKDKKQNNVFKEKKDRLLNAVEEAAVFFEKNLKDSNKVQKHLEKRGIKEGTRKKWRLGYAPEGWRHLYENLSSKGISEKDMLEAGLLKSRDQKKYDTFRDRIIFPIFDTSGNVIAFSGRALDPDDKTPKYLNSPDTPIFNKSEVLYGLNQAGSYIRRADYSVLVEGQFDLVMSHQVGVKNTVALSGTSVTREHIRRLKRFSKNILLCFDPDDAGVKSAYKTAALAFNEGMDVKIAELPEGKDPADCILEDKEEWKRVLTDAPHAILHTLNYISELYSDNRKRIKAAREYTFPLLALMESEMDRSYFMSLIADQLNVPVDNVKIDAEQFAQKDMGATQFSGYHEDGKVPDSEGVEFNPSVKKTERVVRSLALLLKWLQISPQPAYPSELLMEKIKKADADLAKKIEKLEIDPDKDKDILGVDIYCGTLDTSSILGYSDELVFRYKSALLEEKMHELSRSIKETVGDEDLDKKNLSDYQKYSRELHEINNRRNEGDLIYISEN